MKMKKIFKNAVALCLTAIALTSCLKDDTMVLDPEKAGSNIIEFVNPTDISVHGSTTALYSLAYPIVTASTVIPISVSYSGAEDVAPQDITVTVGLGDVATITQYNTEQSKSYTLMDPAVYTINATSVVIPKGKKAATFTVSVKTASFDLTKNYALPLKIKGVSSGTISTNFSNIILNIAAKNKYDGLYTVNATAPFVDLTSSAFTGLYPMKLMSLITQGPNSVAMYDGQYAANAYGHPFLNAGGTSYYGSWSPLFTMDPTSGAVTSVTNYHGQPSANGRSAGLNPAGVNKFTVNADGSKTLEVSYYLLQPGTTIRTMLYEKWTFTGARP